MKTIFKLFIVSIITLVWSSCTKAGKGGAASIAGKVLHHDVIIPNARVFVKYNQSDFPGKDTTKYDDVVSADKQGNYQIRDLKKGKYYVYSVGLDGVANGNPFGVFGGLSVSINSKSEAVQLNIPVTED
jgi:hypothetical protein